MTYHNDHFKFKIMRLFVGSGFLVSHRGLRKPKHFYDLSPLGTMSNHNWRVFHPGKGGGGDLSLLVDTQYMFSLSFQSTVRLCWTLSHLTEPTQSNTKHNVNSLTMHSHSFMRCSCAYAMQYVIAYLYHVTYIMNDVWKILLNMHITNAS